MSVKIVYRPVTKDSQEGYLKVRIIENRKTKFNTLGIKINGKNWLESKQKVSQKEPNADKINKKIEETLKELSQHDNDVQVLQTTSKTILQFYQEIIDTTLNQGTRMKYTNIRNKFVKYLESTGFDDLKFHQLNEVRVKEFHKYIIENGNMVDTANYNIKSFKAIVNKAKKAGIVRFVNDPFANVTFKYSQQKVKSLTAEEIQRLISTRYIDTRNFDFNKRDKLGITLNEISYIFLFQFFTQGLRCSDTQLLRWSNFKFIDGTIYIDYVMFKTKKEMRVNLTPMALKMLKYSFARINPNLEFDIDEIEFRKRDHLADIAKAEEIIKANSKKDEYSQIEYLYAVARKKTGEAAKAEATRLAWLTTQKQIIEMRKGMIKEIDEQIYKMYRDFIIELSLGERKNDFVFYFLSKVDFSNFKTNLFDNLNKQQYTTLTGSRAYYNKLLKDVQKQAKIGITLTSHVARHSYTQLLLENEADITDISYSLGHSNLGTTQTYISKLPSTKVKNINTLISDQFSD